MDLRIKKVTDSRFGILLWILVIFLLTAVISRSVLLGFSWQVIDKGIFSLSKLYLMGLFFDLVAFTYFMIPIVLILLFLPDRFLKKGLLYILLFMVFFIILFNGVSEYFFWEEFGVRYNFIAVDYLVYSLLGLCGLAMVHNGVHWMGDYPVAIAIGYACGRIALARGHHLETRSGALWGKNASLMPFSFARGGVGLSYRYSF
jgi:hypothetical protein